MAVKGFEIGGVTVQPGRSKRVDLAVSVLANSSQMSLPVHVIHGGKPGPVFFMAAAVHGDEIQGVEIIRRTLIGISAHTLAGTVLAVPIVNSFGFLNHSRYMPDRRDLNRSFPGSDKGSLASLLADLFLTQVVVRSQFGIDFHTAALHRTNLPQIRIAPGDSELMKLAEAFAPPVILTAKLRDGSLRQTAGERGVKVLLYEGGEALRFDEGAIDAAVKGTWRLLRHLGMIVEAPELPPHAQTVHTSSSSWLRAPEGGILHTIRRSGDKVREGEEVATITGPLGENPAPVMADDDGIIIGRTHLPIVNRGDALFHIAKLKTKAKTAQTVPDEDEII
ncbi:succinylglutamate desuccinylase/aspartoacylase family protein [Aestuariivirga litoralis]|uniref:succinylglutamate desuccinylase/aspartoacylase family protein n=1 Tax=Aestuariivirga litoralis TaxID=2650924 RepID=UPI0018C7D0F9|nr:succinylglutamate desuccinylase/aspartoacylase family protein [Aestuariivirga litoralis]MBG1232487.1 succinylglutamate desuccinylase/aspartoacylase family protein [Aestuariivirga litoralis]